MAVHLLIDGYNLIGSRSGTLGDIEEAREYLIDCLVAYKRLKKARITVVFDGPSMSYPERGPAGIEVLFSCGRDADSVIKELVAKKGGGATVVTSDRDVASFARAKGAVVLASDEFQILLDDALYQDMKGVDPLDEEEGSGPGKKGPSRKPPKEERRKQGRIRKLRGS
ncbi:MAG: hypothetical protein A2V21_309885 [Deltaproteobacteria bacterium GWC2_55_46]|nr:MAG: hypothetical protein A2Z79_03985 [Deltaproteobacteria bacterium GWA2_55_82]OGQ64088.1 MAG: hypothetical protein A3I81_10360 [Deltaproteobacteria bacterium RIFCSPLOWO2_02_FULL_55_12]OIJ74540.1 MAG: hypothetical protein A2V21_309885 [Deltaproteobacteria bacterium GWC2_55_46]